MLEVSHSMPDHYPFCRIVGQPLLKTALLLVSIDPRIGGLLISGARGSAKSTIVRGLSDLQPDKPFVTLPLGATEEMITGSLDLESALSDSEVRFCPGLLARSHRGFLYVDEVNLLFDHLVDLLLDAAASGVNIVERDNISHRHDANFVLIGTMNPDEGELRPQLLDRFGLMVEMETDFTTEERKEIVRRRLAFDRDSGKMIQDSQAESDQIRQKIQWARDNLRRVELSDRIETQIAERCRRAEVEGMRADIVFHRAVTAWCALDQRLEVMADDLDVVEPMVMNHRRNIQPDDATRPGGGHSGHSGDNNSGQNGSDQDGGSQSGSSIQGSWGAMQPVPCESLPLSAFPLPMPRRIPGDSPVRQRMVGRNGNRDRHGRAGGAKYGTRDTGGNRKIDWAGTLHAARFGSLPCEDRRQSLQQSLKYRHQLPGAVNLDLIVLDTSASTLSGQGLGRARGAIQAFSSQSYRARRLLSLVTFGNDEVRILLEVQRAPRNVESVLDRIQAGGGTPVRQALNRIDGILSRRKYRHLNCHIWLITDGRFDESMSGYRSIHSHPVTLIDIECGRTPLGRGRQLAQQIEADYLHVSSLSLPGSTPGFTQTGAQS